MSTPGVEVVLRPLAAGDLDQLDALERRLFDAAAWSRQSFAEELEADGRWYVGAERVADGSLVGYAGLWFDGYDAQVMTIAVDAAHQGHGLGRSLLQDALLRCAAAAREVGVRACVVHALPPARPFYEAFGFEPSPSDSLHLSLLMKDLEKFLAEKG